MQESSIIFLPSYYEGQPLTILEAMSFGCIPMLSHNCHCDFLQNTALDTFISKDNDADFYINQIKTLKQLDQKDLNTLRQESMKIVQSLSWDIISDAYLKVVTQMLLSAHQPPRSKD
jgi:glycosyltransferase involved in cell wall biosynthesis